jgi:hypothetical protein
MANLALGRAWHHRRLLPNLFRLLPNLGWLIGRKQFLALLILAAVLVEGLLALRFFVQVSGNYSPAVMQFSEPLVSPFKEYEPSYSEKTTGVFEYSTVLAAEVYLVIAAVLVIWIALIPVAVSIVRSFIWGMQMTFQAARTTDAGMAFVVERYQVRERIRAAINWTALTLAAFSVWTWHMCWSFAVWSWHTLCALAVALDAWLMREQRQIVHLSVSTAVWCKRTAIRTALALDTWAMRRQQQITAGSVRTASWTKRAVMNTVLAIDAWAMKAQGALAAAFVASARLSWKLVCGIARAVDHWFMVVQRAVLRIAGACPRALVAALLWPARTLVRVARAIDAALLNVQHRIGSVLHFVAVHPVRAAVSEVRFAKQKSFAAVRSGAASCLRWTERVVRSDRAP